MKYSKTVCMEKDAWEIIETLQKRTRKSISHTIEIILYQWLRFQQDKDKTKTIVKEEVDNYFDQMKSSKVVK